jgi:AcrR family transcriptional regulator
VARPRKSEERNTRQDILDVSLDLFAEKGFFGTSMRDIAKKVGVRESALYHHFSSKAAMLEGLLQTLGPGHARVLTQLDLGEMLDAHGGLGFLRHVADFMIATWATEHEQKMFRLILSEGSRLGEREVLNLPNYMRSARATLSGVFSEMMKRKLIRKADPICVTMGFIAPMIMLRSLYLVMPKRPHDLKGLTAEAHRFIDFYWRCIQ